MDNEPQDWEELLSAEELDVLDESLDVFDSDEVEIVKFECPDCGDVFDFPEELDFHDCPWQWAQGGGR